jgi:NAD(P)-dependent dehydrogenase (short-subunit alcohol dehydrogenase family)
VVGAGQTHGDGIGNGRATAVLFAREGARVLAVDRDLDALEETIALAEGLDVRPHTADVTDSTAVAEMVRAAGPLDVLVNNVGGSYPGGPEELDEDAWDAQLDLNLKSAYLACRHALPALRARGGGAIVNTASTSGIRWTGSPQVAYAAAKAGVIQLTKVVAVQHAPAGIRANCVVPGQLHTPMVEARLAGQRASGDVAGLLEQRQARIPLGFMGDGRDTAYAALFLASDEARFVTGTEIVVDGGMSARCD